MGQGREWWGSRVGWGSVWCSEESIVWGSVWGNVDCRGQCMGRCEAEQGRQGRGRMGGDSSRKWGEQKGPQKHPHHCCLKEK